MHYFGLTAFLLLFSVVGLTQAFVLPNSQVIIDSGISSIEVIINEQPPLEGWVYAESDSNSSDTAIQRPYFTFYFNEMGRVDSQLYSLDLPKRPGVRLKYDSLGRIIELCESVEGRPQYRWQRIWPANEGWVYRQWEDGAVIRTTMLSPDSVILKDSAISGGIRSTYQYDPLTEEFTSEYYKDDKLCARTYQKWIMKNDLPDSLLLVSEYFNKLIPRLMSSASVGTYTAKHNVLETGEVVHLPESAFSTSVENLTFEERLNRHQGITLFYERNMIADHLAERGPTTYTHSFSNLTKRTFISYIYHYR